MALYAIGDLHLSFGVNKPMDVFGNRWENYVEKLIEGFKIVKDTDVCVLCGDLSWGINLQEAREDFLYIDRLPGKKILLKGNHDYWWTTVTKLKRFFKELSIDSMDILHNNCFFYGDELAICGTRGWFYEEEKGSDLDKKILAREVGRLETSLQAAGDKEKIVFLHYPPIYMGYRCDEILALLEKHQVSRCYYGHIHSHGCRQAFERDYGGTSFKLVSADYLAFIPHKVL